MNLSPLKKLLWGDGRGERLPKNRKQAFKYYTKTEFWKLLLCGVMTSAFFLPSLAWLYIANYSKAQALSALEAGAPDYLSSYAELTLRHSFSTFSVLIPLLALLFVGISGMLGICKLMIFAQNCSYRQYFMAIKQNGAQSALCGLGFGLSLFLLAYNVTYYNVSSFRSVTKGVMIGVSVLQFVFACVSQMYLMCGLAVYKNTFVKHISNAVRLTFALFWRNIAVVGLCSLPFIVTLLTPAPYQVILLMLLPMFYVGFCALAIICYANSVFDRYINPMLGEKCVGIGLEKQ